MPRHNWIQAMTWTKAPPPLSETPSSARISSDPEGDDSVSID